MAATINMVTVLETCQVSPPPATVGRKSLSLTFFDIHWLLSHPVHQLFFYEFAHSRAHFTNIVVPRLKHSLSITLRHFFPFVSNLIVFPTLNDLPGVHKKPEICHGEGDSVTLTVAESTLDFNDLVGNHPRRCDKFYPLVPLLRHATKASDHVAIPLFSVQVTHFPNTGFSIGISNHHVLCDASAKFQFLKAWTSVAKWGNDESFLAKGSLPLYDRVIKYPDTLDKKILSHKDVETLEKYQQWKLVAPTDKVRATFVFTREKINQLKEWASTQLPKLEYVSSFSVTCAYLWSCIAKSRADVGEKRGEDQLERFVCSADCRSRLDPLIPQTYFGNCVMPCSAITKSSLLSRNNGFVEATAVLGEAISKAVNNKDGVIKNAETWYDDFGVSMKIGVAGTPKLDIYDMDFGWGKPRKYETINIDYNGSISMNVCKESMEDLEIGLSLPANQMDAFAAIFTAGLANASFEQK